MKNWFRKHLHRTCAVATGVALALVATVSVASPAAAADSGTLSFPTCGVNQAQVDNSPGNGAASWAWLWRSTWVSETILTVEFYNGSLAHIELYGSDTVGSASYWTDDIWRARIECYTGGSNNGNGPWYYFDRG